mmetsp:Transcript_11560/g.21189  ORF Transcript_11560/g.21189 Transcript_11560/m.21189 type:complete len:263 (+) Transcript_11560:197-985(+)
MLYDDGENANSTSLGFDRNSVELKVSKRAFDCPEVDFWANENDLKVTTSAPSFEGLGEDRIRPVPPTKKRRMKSGEETSMLESAHTDESKPETSNECPDFVAPVEWRTIRSEITKDLKVGEWAFDCATLQMWWSKEVCRIFHLDHKHTEPSFASYKNFLHKDDKDLVLFLFQRALEKGIPYELSHRFRMPDNKVKWCRVKCRVQQDPASGVTKLFGTIQDITLWSKSVIDGRRQGMGSGVESKDDRTAGQNIVKEDLTCSIC